MTDITKGQGRRNAKLASLPIGMAGRAAAGFGKRMVGRDKDEVNQELLRSPPNNCSPFSANSRAAP